MVKRISTILFILANSAVPVAGHAEPASIYTRNGNELSVTGSSYLYEEPTLNVSMTGDKFGLNHTGTLQLKNDWFLKEDVRFAYGKVDYVGTGIQSGAPDWYYEVRGLLGRDVQVSSVVLSPYIGFGYRYLFNDVRGYSSTGSAGYRRESNYYYMPLGVTHRLQMKDQAVLSTTVEFDYLLWGEQLTRLSDLIGQGGFVNAADTTNRQRSGYGLRLNMMYEMSDWGFGPFIHYWNIADSDVTYQVMTDALGPALVSLREPKNQTTEYGFRVMFRF